MRGGRGGYIRMSPDFRTSMVHLREVSPKRDPEEALGYTGITKGIWSLQGDVEKLTGHAGRFGVRAQQPMALGFELCGH